MRVGASSRAVPDDLIRFWFEFPEQDDHGCRLPYRCGVSAWSEGDALRLVGDTYCQEKVAPRPTVAVPNFDVSRLDGDENVRPNLGVPVWRGIWYPFITTS